NHWDPSNDAASDLFFRESRETFLEDKNVVEQQQLRLTEFGEDWLVDIVSDATRIRMRRFLNGMLEQEQRRAAEEGRGGMFIRNAWYIAAWADELSDKPLARRILNEPVVLFRDKSGKAAAIADRCCHRGTPLS